MPKIEKRELDDNQREQIDSMFGHQTKTQPDNANPGKEDEQKQQELEPGAEQAAEENQQEEQQASEKQDEAKPSDKKQEDDGQAPPTDDVVERLRARVAELETGSYMEHTKQAEQEAPKQEQEEPPSKVIEQFITDEEFDEIQTNPAKLNEVMLRVYQRAVADTSEHVMRQIPELVQVSSARQISMAEAVRGFYAENPDLRKHAQYVGFIANQVKSKSPDLDVKSVLAETEKRVREHLSLSKQAEQQEEGRQKTANGANKPAFVQRGSGSHKGGNADTRTDFQKQADEMLKTLRR